MDDSNDSNNLLPVEKQFPNIWNLYRFQNVTLIIYFITFRLLGSFVKKNYWLSFKGFKRYRLQNLSICWLHAVVVGSFDLIYMLFHQYEIFNDVKEYHSIIAVQIPLISVAYFIHDAIDMLSYEWSKWTTELLFHHMATCFALICPALVDKYVVATCWALLMEVNSVFLHARTILQICGLSQKFPSVYRSVVVLNIVTFVLFRVIAQLVWVSLAIQFVIGSHWYFLLVGLGGPVIFAVINGMLLMRILASDGYLPNAMGDKFSMTRDKEDPPPPSSVENRGSDREKSKKKTN